MHRKITATAASAFAIVSLAFAPLIVEAAAIPVTATVASTATITATTNPTAVNYTGQATQAVPFSITVSSNDTLGFTFQFVGTNSATAFQLNGVTTPANTLPYTVTDVNGAYTPAVAGAHVYIPSSATAVAYNFNVNLGAPGLLVTDTYSDTLQATVNVQ